MVKDEVIQKSALLITQPLFKFDPELVIINISDQITHYVPDSVDVSMSTGGVSEVERLFFSSHVRIVQSCFADIFLILYEHIKYTSAARSDAVTDALWLHLNIKPFVPLTLSVIILKLLVSHV